MKLSYSRPLTRFTIVFFTVLLTCCYLVPDFVGAAARPGQYHINKEYLSSLVSDFGAVWSSPRRWGKKDLLTFSAVLGTGLVLYAFDQEIHTWIQDRQSSSTRDTAHFVSNFGHGFFLGALLTGLYASGELAQKEGLRRTALLGLQSWLTSGAIVLSLKFVVGRARPKTGKGSHSFEPFSTGSSFYSFPSGHSASIFSVAAVISDQTDSVLVDLCAYGVASAVAVSRISEEKHWISDVFIGSAIGYFVGKKICALHRSRAGDRVKLGFHLSPHSQGLTLTYTF